jgi:predicted AAA+ superfamily ATPase
MIYGRELRKKLSDWFDSREILLVYGARQVGKTTLMHQLTDSMDKVLFLDCESPVVFDVLMSRDLARIRSLFGSDRVIVLDEAQVIPGIGECLKLIYDTCPEYKLLVTGSSSFELSNRVSEPLTGRHLRFQLLPLSASETLTVHQPLWYYENQNNILVYGTYPGIIDLPEEKKFRKLEELTSDYLFKDILAFESLKNAGQLRNLLRALALQTGNLISVRELSVLLGIPVYYVERYIDLLEKSFVIFSLGSFSNNLRNELKKRRKIYFYDNGIRNAVIRQFGHPDDRADKGTLWENYVISERMKMNLLKNYPVNMFFWRTYDGAEIDLVEETNGQLAAYECKWNPAKKPQIPLSFSSKYGITTIHAIHPKNCLQYFIVT